MSKLNENDLHEGIIEFANNANASIKIDDKPIFIYKKNTLNALNNDLVKVKITKVKNKFEAEVQEVLERHRTQFVGKVHMNNKTTFVVPDNKKITTDFYIKELHGATDGQKVLIDFLSWDIESKSPIGIITKILGDPGDNNTEMNSIMYKYGLPNEFPLMVEAEAELISFDIKQSEIDERLDMRDVTTFTIDPLTAKDFDDALSIKFDGNLTEVGIHIADVSHYIKQGGIIDEEAINRATSVYLVDRCVPMLPERLSNGVCSLRPNEDKLCFSVVVTIDENGDVVKQWIGKTVINSNTRYTYEEAQEVIEGGEGEHKMEILKLDELAKKMRGQRIKEGSIEMSSIEFRFQLDEITKKPIGVTFKVQKDANKLIEEFMLLANKVVAKTLSEAKQTNVYRTHSGPNLEKLEALALLCKNFGYNFIISEDKNDVKAGLNSLLLEIKGTPEENMISTLITRCMSKATYTTINTGHYGLGFTHYSHFTSPIRRYPDVITHRVLFDYLKGKPKGNVNTIEKSAKWCSDREILASKAERDSIKYKQMEYLENKIGSIFEGIVSGITDWGIYVEIIENKCEGMIRYKNSFKVDTENYVVYPNSGGAIRLGDTINIVVRSIDLEKKQIDFELM